MGPERAPVGYYAGGVLMSGMVLHAVAMAKCMLGLLVRGVRLEFVVFYMVMACADYWHGSDSDRLVLILRQYEDLDYPYCETI